MIRQGRKRLKMSQLQFGELMGVSVAAVCQWEMGRRYPTQPTRKFFELLSLHHGLKFDANGILIPDSPKKRLTRVKAL